MKVSKNLLPNENGKIILPFPIQASSKIPVIHKVVDKDGIELSGEKGRSINVDFKIISEDWNAYRLGDGTRITVRQVVASVKRMLDMYDSHGTPIYLVDSTNIIHVDPPEKR